MKVEITDPAEASLQRIYCLYPEEIADQIIGRILDRSETLSNFPDRGRIVEELRSMNEGHRYILEGHYKIIYKQGSNIVYVTDVFDMRQYPTKSEQTHRQEPPVPNQ